MDPNTSGILGQLGSWFEYPFNNPIDWKTVGLIAAIVLIAFFFAHDAIRIAHEVAEGA
jgi:hypothetical protein